jgi:penicillin-binding protein 1C
MFALHNRLPAARWLAQPTRALRRVQVCRNDGYLANDSCESAPEWVPIASHFERQSPYNQLVHLDASGRDRVDDQCERVTNMHHANWFVLPATQEYYYQRHHAGYRALPAFRSGCGLSANNGRAQMDFIYPAAGVEVYIPFDLDGRKGRVVIEAVHRDPDAELNWHVDGRFVGATRSFHQQALDLTAGEHQITIVDKLGNRLERHFKVLARETATQSTMPTLAHYRSKRGVG